ncbi:MAG: FixH family protein [Candidatus Kapabacteria bacterium]|nr:FixH family protein [Ignavibacteriota bacterium]MCW5885327.1 FixH family protein [Candidatus Kapabacteria bacterium]
MAKFKLHWGNSIAIFYISFVLVLVGFVIFTRFNRVELVDENYYEKELKYQNVIDKMDRAGKLPEPLSIESSDSYVRFSYPKSVDQGDISGEITFFRPSDKKLDFTLPVKPDESGFQVVGSSNLEKGMWRVKVDWAVGDTTYYNEQVLVIN